MSDTNTGGTEWMIHRFICPDCGSTSRADRVVSCFRCGSEMETDEWKIGIVTDVSDADGRGETDG